MENLLLKYWRTSVQELIEEIVKISLTYPNE